MTHENGSSEEMGMEGGGMQPPSSSTRLRRSQWVDMSLEERKAYVTALMSGHDRDYDPALFEDAFPINDVVNLYSDNQAVDSWNKNVTSQLRWESCN
ncbi:hypothetical protein BS47DRAFT_1344408 [Hydnum rufescens UP504]|uniref:Uncharacterized protein n=1 Tax=Hydnum rufescens UP504 TaxID=1448309 RepID=A0A9P6AWK4_9AGAM|nr:hypothetical protein BS47DRAFT_1344408 [Hydnum rufescens UP504]